MLTGNRPFTGETTAEILSSVMQDQPSLEGLQATVRPLLARCLEKNPRQRLQAIGEARIALENLEAPQAAGPPAPQTQHMALRHWAGWAVAIILALALAFLYSRQQPPAERTLRYTIAPPENSTVWNFAISPDGKLLAIVAALAKSAAGGSRVSGYAQRLPRECHYLSYLLHGIAATANRVLAEKSILHREH